tara:strand:- start:782 stop:895 length:114 start_codon:yes stop_codon:yes gene_type:complete
MNQHMAEISRHVAGNAYAVLIMDQAYFNALTPILAAA